MAARRPRPSREWGRPSRTAVLLSAGSIVLISRARSSRALDRDHPQPWPASPCSRARSAWLRLARGGRPGSPLPSLTVPEPHSRLRVEAISSRATWFPARPTTTVTVLPRRPLRSRDTRTMPSPPARGRFRADAASSRRRRQFEQRSSRPRSVSCTTRLDHADDYAGQRGRRRIIQYTQGGNVGEARDGDHAADDAGAVPRAARGRRSS